MDKTVFTGYNESARILINPNQKEIHGEPDELADLIQYALTDAILENPQLRRQVLKAFRRVRFDTMPEVLRYWLEGWPFTLVGMAALFGVLYGFAALMQQIGA